MDIRIIYSLDAKNKVRFWRAEVEGRRWRTTAGLLDGRPVTSEWTECTGKQGRSHDQQAFFEAHAERKKKLDRDYRETIEDLVNLPRSPMLAQKFQEQKDLQKESYSHDPLYSQPKLDGIRSLITIDGARSRDFQPQVNIDHILEALKPAFDYIPSLKLDGELYNHDLKDDFNSISSIVRQKRVTDADRERSEQFIQYHLYDVMLDGKRFKFRTGFLEFIYNRFLKDSPYIVLVKTNCVTSKTILDELYAHYLEDGYEGQMVRRDGLYESKRSKQLLKRKEFITNEFTLVDIEEGKGNWAGHAKRVFFRYFTGKIVKATPKGTKAFTKKLLEEKDKYIGSPVTVRYFTPTPDDVPRFGIATDFHPGGRID